MNGDEEREEVDIQEPAPGGYCRTNCRSERWGASDKSRQMMIDVASKRPEEDICRALLSAAPAKGRRRRLPTIHTMQAVIIMRCPSSLAEGREGRLSAAG